MLNLTTRMCWILVKKEGYIAIWQKPTNNTCYLSRDAAGIMPPLCNSEDDPDSVWYVFAMPFFRFFKFKKLLFGSQSF
uniref:Methyltransferase n=1 Tax=Noccaea caerulescens TaxID=107243 RepID=A0A1J3DHE7_NOCCA